MKADPAARVGEAFAHLEAQEGGSFCGELACRFGSSSRKGDYGNAPASAHETFGKQKDLAFSPGQPVQRGDDESDVVHRDGPCTVWSIRAS